MLWWPKNFKFVFWRILTVNCQSIQLNWDISRLKLESHSTRMWGNFGQKLQNCLKIRQLHVKFCYCKSNEKKLWLCWREQVKPGPHYAGGICKRRLHSENVFRPHYTGGIRNATINGHFGFVFEKNLGQWNHIIIVRSSFSKSSVFKMCSVHTKTKSQRFQIPPVWRAFS